MPDLISSLLPLYTYGESKNSSNRSSAPELAMPTRCQLFDVSEDNKFLALIDDNFMLQVYELNNFQDEKQLKRQTMKDIPCKIKCKNPTCVYISVASETGHVAVSFLQMNGSGETLKKSTMSDEFMKFKIHKKKNYKKDEQNEAFDKDYATCRIYQENKGDILEIPFQGRAVFTKGELVLIGQWSLGVYNADTLKMMHSFKSGSFCLDNDAYFHFSSCYQARGYMLQNESDQKYNAGYGLAAISEHIRKGVIAVYEKNINSYQRRSTKIWSILTGSLICSFMRNLDEHIIYVSDDHRFLVTSDPGNSALNTYCMKSGTCLGTYKPQGLKGDRGKSTILLVKHIARQDYMLIMGITVKDSEEIEELDETDCFFVEIFSMERQMEVKYVEQSTTISPNSIFALGTFQNEEFLNIPSDFYGIFWETTGNDNRRLNFRTVQLDLHLSHPKTNGLFQNRLWDTFLYKYIGTEDEGGFRTSVFKFSYISSDKTILYLLEKNIDKYVLLISPYVVQLWQLEASDDGDKEHNILHFSNTPGEINYYLDFSSSSLIYAKSYNGLNYKVSTIGAIQRLIIEDKDQYCRPDVHFLRNEGYIFVNVKSNPGSSISEEIILPLSESTTKTTSFQRSHITDNVSKDDFYGIESCLLALLYAYWVDDQSYNRHDSCQYVILGKTEDLLKSIISPIENTTYFQTISASKILMKLAYFDKGLELIMNIVLQKGFHVAIHNFPTDDNENLLTVLIKRKKLDLFQILFNQAILNYYNGEPVDLYPLMDAILCLQKNKLPGLLLKCIDILSYLPVNSESAGLCGWEYNTPGDYKSFNNFTVFHQMKKHHSAISILLQSRQTSVKGTANSDSEIYFDSNEICVIPLPTLNVYDAISYSILTKNSPYSRTNAIKEMLEYESPVIEVLLTYRWQNYIKSRFYMILFIQVLFYIFYTVSISFSEEIFNYKPGTPIRNPKHLICLAVTFLTWMLFLLQEMKQMVTLKWEYWRSTFNYIDILAAALPLVTFILLITNDSHLYEISALTALTLWLHFILRLRANRRMGILIEIVIQLGVKIAPIIGLMILLIIAFTHSFAILLRMHDDSFFQEQFEGDIASNESILGSNVALSDQSQQNLFKDAFLGFTTVWFFLYGIFDPIFSGDVGNYPMALVLAILFSLITALVILNVVIALMTGAIDETEKKGNRNWHIHLADVSNEVEKLLPWFIEKDSAKNIYYRTSRSTVDAHHDKIKNETKRFKERLLKRRERGKPL